MAKRNGANGLDVTIEMLQRLSASGLTYTHALVALETLRQQRAGTKARLMVISGRLGIPYTTIARAAFELTEKGLADYEAVKGDRRSKYLVITNPKRVEKLFAR